MPPADGRLSVFDTHRASESTIWRIGMSIATERNQNLHARADILSSAVSRQGSLRVVRDEPPFRHRNIIGWPPENQKEDRILIAMELAALATLRLPT
jgi:hypothetical protein